MKSEARRWSRQGDPERAKMARQISRDIERARDTVHS